MEWSGFFVSFSFLFIFMITFFLPYLWMIWTKYSHDLLCFQHAQKVFLVIIFHSFPFLDYDTIQKFNKRNY